MEFAVRTLEALILLSFVIFVHELGHFMVARWCGVLVERFSIGMGPVLASFRIGDTEYAISAIPIGGYVKMLGQTDTPEVEERDDDERSYQNKSVPQRMAIISAGVIMNVIFGFLFFAIAFRMGVPYTVAVVGPTIPGGPAWTAGLRPGDKIVGINGRPRDDFSSVMLEVALTNPASETVDLKVQQGDEVNAFEIVPSKEDLRPMIGVGPDFGLKLADIETPTREKSPARVADPGFLPGDEILAINGSSVGSYREYVDGMYRLQDEAVTLTVRRKGEDGVSGETVDLDIEPNYVRTLGLEMTIGPIVAIQENSPATRARNEDGKIVPLKADDRIIAVDDQEVVDALRLPEMLSARAGEEVRLTVLRPDRPSDERLDLFVTPRKAAPWEELPMYWTVEDDYPMSVPALGIAYKVPPIIRRVTPDGPADQATKPLRPDDRILEATLAFHMPGRDESEVEEWTVTVGDEHWPSVFWAMQVYDVKKVDLKIEGREEPVTLSPRRDLDRPLYLRGLLFEWNRGEQREATLAGAVVRGYDKTRDWIAKLYLTLRGIAIGTISPKNLSGPIQIATNAYMLTEEKFALLLQYFGMLSINLAIINFLPIPILDGGHMAFLLYELIARRPASERVILIANYVGVFLILGLLIFVVTLDLTQLANWR